MGTGPEDPLVLSFCGEGESVEGGSTLSWGRILSSKRWNRPSERWGRHWEGSATQPQGCGLTSSFSGRLP